MTARIGTILVSTSLLEQLLHLPEDHRIRGLRLPNSFDDTFEIAVEGPSLPLRQEGSAIQRVRYEIAVTEGPELVPVKTFVGKFI